MNHILLFEKWGISNELESTAKKFHSEILNSESNEFVFNFMGGLIKVIVGGYPGTKNKNMLGQYYHYNNTIYLKDRGDYPTFLHELKHAERANKSYSKSFTKRASAWMDINSPPKQDLFMVFYIYDEEEFEAKYNGWYAYIDDYLKNNPLVKYDPSSDDIINLVNEAFDKCPDKTWIYYKSPIEIKLSEISNVSYLKNLIQGTSKLKMYTDGTFDSPKNYGKFRKFIDRLIDYFDLGKNDEVFQNKKEKLEKYLNSNKEKFSRKLNRIYSIMVDRYATTK